MNFIITNYVLLIMLIGMFILTAFDVFLEPKMITRLRMTLAMLFALAVFDTLEQKTADFEEPTVWRILFSAICYSLRPMIVMMLIFLVDRKMHWIITIPTALNIIVAFSAFFTDISYSFNEENHFQRGFLGYTPYITLVVYVIIFFLVSFRVLANHAVEEGVVVMFLAIAASIAALLAVYAHDEIINLTYGAEIMIYYLYMYGQYTKRDPLTGLYNRQSFYHDIEKNKDNISGIISIDMNELKWMNDTLGHAEGDKALKTVSECFIRATATNEKVYRIGGDEFVVIFKKRAPEDMVSIVEKMRAEVANSGYSCAFGLSVNKTADEMMKEADELMYEDKAKIKAEIAEKGGILHTRA